MQEATSPAGCVVPEAQSCATHAFGLAAQSAPVEVALRVRRRNRSLDDVFSSRSYPSVMGGENEGTITCFARCHVHVGGARVEQL